MKRFVILAALTLTVWSANVRISQADETPAPGTLITIAGNGKSSGSTTGPLATDLPLDELWGMVLDSQGDVLFNDGPHTHAWKISREGSLSSLAAIHANDIAIDGKGNIYFAQYELHHFVRLSPKGELSVIMGQGTVPFDQAEGKLATTAKVYSPAAVAVDASDNLYTLEWAKTLIRRISQDGTLTVIVDASGEDGDEGDGGPARDAQFHHAGSMVFDLSGNLYFADTGNHRIRKIGTDGIISTVAGTGKSGFSGDGGPAVNADLNAPGFVAVDSAGDMFISDTNNFRIRKITPDGNITTLAGTGKRGFSGEGGLAANAQLQGPFCLALDAAGTLYFGDDSPIDSRGFALMHDGSHIRKIYGAGAPGVFAGRLFPGGDLNADGKVNVQDASLALQFAVGAITPSDPQLKAGDLNGDGTLNIQDATLILQKAIGL